MSDLPRAHTRTIKELYTHIYATTWQHLSDEARSLLQIMPLVAESGGTPEHIQTISKLQSSEFWDAVEELTQQSLLEPRGTDDDVRYGIHRLTETFLQTEITKWPHDH